MKGQSSATVTPKRRLLPVDPTGISIATTRPYRRPLPGDFSLVHIQQTFLHLPASIIVDFLYLIVRS